MNEYVIIIIHYSDNDGCVLNKASGCQCGGAMEKSKIILHEENCNEKDLEYVISLNCSYLLAQEQGCPSLT